MNVNLRPDLERRVFEVVSRGEYRSSDALVEQAIERFLDEGHGEAQWLESLLDEAEASGEPSELTHEKWDVLEREALASAQRKAL